MARTLSRNEKERGMPKSRDYVDSLTAELRVGRQGWRAIRPCVTRYVLPDGTEFFDWHEVTALIQRTARAEPPSRRRPAA
jgi:hypothetical protein